jgi:hypothetical protein
MPSEVMISTSSGRRRRMSKINPKPTAKTYGAQGPGWLSIELANTATPTAMATA